jgi:hypothetical protein
MFSVSLSMLTVMYVPFCVFCFIVLFCVLFVCKCVLYCTVLYCTVLYCTALYCTVPYCTVLYYYHRNSTDLQLMGIYQYLHKYQYDETRRFIVVYTTARHLFVSRTTCIQSNDPHIQFLYCSFSLLTSTTRSSQLLLSFKLHHTNQCRHVPSPSRILYTLPISHAFV